MAPLAQPLRQEVRVHLEAASERLDNRMFKMGDDRYSHEADRISCSISGYGNGAERGLAPPEWVDLIYLKQSFGEGRPQDQA
ncbi:hypothetical protein U1872_05035 [Sphingomonas sp. RB3P16]|uniref:hypothetical protein n=1 Tax=Parasphingomonas frigoris TaxID=3096163 RepID=UPI002FCC6ECE